MRWRTVSLAAGDRRPCSPGAPRTQWLSSRRTAGGRPPDHLLLMSQQYRKGKDGQYGPDFDDRAQQDGVGCADARPGLADAGPRHRRFRGRLPGLGAPRPLGPRFKDGLDLSSFEQSLLTAVPVVLGSPGRIQVSALTDRFGGLVMFPIVSAATIVKVLRLGLAGHSSLAALLIGGFFPDRRPRPATANGSDCLTSCVRRGAVPTGREESTAALRGMAVHPTSAHGHPHPCATRLRQGGRRRRTPYPRSRRGEELSQLRGRHGPRPDPSPLSPAQIRARRTMPSPTRGDNAVRAVEGVVDVANGS